MSEDFLYISALQHYAFCPRQFALIHIEQAWAENHFTAEGRLLHERVDSHEPEMRGNVRFERTVSVISHRLKLMGKLDLLEVEGKGSEKYFPVEYKRGKPKVEDWDRVQLCAQALCLEEMRNCQVEEGAIWYWEVRKRERIAIDDGLRATTLETIQKAQELLSSGKTPPPTPHVKRCQACSLVDICCPQLLKNDHSKKYVEELFSI